MRCEWSNNGKERDMKIEACVTIELTGKRHQIIGEDVRVPHGS